LQTLLETNQALLKKRPKSAKPIRPKDTAERYYRAQLRQIVQAMARAVDEGLTPILKAEYTADSPMVDRIIAMLNRLAARFTGTAYANQAYRLAQSTLSMAEADSTAAFVSSVNRAVGVDMGRLMTSGGLDEYLAAATAENVALIKSLSADYFSKIEQAVMNGIRSGESTTVIAKNIQAETGVTYRRAKLIARDQTLKAQSDISRKRQIQAGLTRFQWRTSSDQRVAGNPAGRYPNAKIKCYMLARQDIGYGPGVYLLEKGAKYAGETGLFPGRAHINCRCRMKSLIEGVDY
jgi:SPP1 gp7 family putative phage head morphogenesis protein